jgi:RimJ/RimL family protein N-acetyltransferase
MSDSLARVSGGPADGARYLVFGASDCLPVAARSALPPEYRVSIWRPTPAEARVPGDDRRVPLVWWAMHYARLFANQDYCQLVIQHGRELVHRSAVFPRYLRFPFMSAVDLQIGDTWTHPAHRGRGLARTAIQEILHAFAEHDRTVWYITDSANTASVRAALSGGLRPRGQCLRTTRFGLRVFGAFELVQAAESHTTPHHVSHR